VKKKIALHLCLLLGPVAMSCGSTEAPTLIKEVDVPIAAPPDRFGLSPTGPYGPPITYTADDVENPLDTVNQLFRFYREQLPELGWEYQGGAGPGFDRLIPDWYLGRSHWLLQTDEGPRGILVYTSAKDSIVTLAVYCCGPDNGKP
jgi:hypothetical protein